MGAGNAFKSATTMGKCQRCVLAMRVSAQHQNHGITLKCTSPPVTPIARNSSLTEAVPNALYRLSLLCPTNTSTPTERAASYTSGPIQKHCTLLSTATVGIAVPQVAPQPPTATSRPADCCATGMPKSRACKVNVSVAQTTAN